MRSDRLRNSQPTWSNPRQARPEVEPPVQINEETTAISEEQLQGNVGTEEDVAATQPVETGESETGNGKEPGTKEEKREILKTVRSERSQTSCKETSERFLRKDAVRRLLSNPLIQS